MKAFKSSRENTLKSHAIDNQEQRKTNREIPDSQTKINLLSCGRYQPSGVLQLTGDLISKPTVGPHASNRTGMSDRVKGGVEKLSGFEMSEVQVPCNLDEFVQLQAHVYTQRNHVYSRPRKGRHLPNVVQKKHESMHQSDGFVRDLVQNISRSSPIVGSETGVSVEISPNSNIPPIQLGAKPISRVPNMRLLQRSVNEVHKSKGSVFQFQFSNSISQLMKSSGISKNKDGEDSRDVLLVFRKVEPDNPEKVVDPNEDAELEKIRQSIFNSFSELAYILANKVEELIAPHKTSMAIPEDVQLLIDLKDEIGGERLSHFQTLIIVKDFPAFLSKNLVRLQSRERYYYDTKLVPLILRINNFMTKESLEEGQEKMLKNIRKLLDSTHVQMNLLLDLGDMRAQPGTSQVINVNGVLASISYVSETPGLDLDRGLYLWNFARVEEGAKGNLTNILGQLVGAMKIKKATDIYLECKPWMVKYYEGKRAEKVTKLQEFP